MCNTSDDVSSALPSSLVCVVGCIDVGETAAVTPLRLPWYAVRVRTHAEKAVASALRAKGYEEYLPLYRQRSRWTDRIKTLERPLFPGYVFCRLDPALRRPLLVIPGVHGIVSFGRTFVPIDNSEIDTVRRVVLTDLPARPNPFVCEGQRVRIRSGVLEGVQGVLIRIKNAWCVVVSITILRRSVAVEIDRDCVEAVL